MAIAFKNGNFKGTVLNLDTADTEEILAYVSDTQYLFRHIHTSSHLDILRSMFVLMMSSETANRMMHPLMT